ncbi:Rhodanese-related sulfurtransferase [Alteromonadaceae bacterium Bs31]|nr:Rhodanese-related sulfurtransferase [Alteromonadaceae bacterium Bs31]
MSISRISAADFVSARKSNSNKTIIDIRTPAECQRQYLPGSVYLPLQRLNAESVAQYLPKTASPDNSIYLLCQSGIRAEAAARKLAGLKNVEWVVIEDGLSGIKACGGPVVAGERKAMSLERQVRIAAGLVILAGVILGSLSSPLFYALSAFVGGGLVFAGITDRCGLAFVLARLPWNQ